MPLQTILITGCGPGGIGSALAIEFQMRGHRVLATDVSAAHLAPLRDRGIETLELDVTSEDSIAQAVRDVAVLTGGNKDEGGFLDILINNAGIMHVMPFADATVADARRVFDVNVLGVVAVTQAFLPLLLTSARRNNPHDAGGGGPMVVNICSINSQVRPPFFGIYNASKAAIEVLGGTIRPELAPLGIRVVTVKTGSVHTELFGNLAPTRLPERSLYAAARGFIEGREMLERAPHMDREVYARRVVDELLRPEVKKVIWQGGLTTFAWVLSWFGWEGMLVSCDFFGPLDIDYYCANENRMAST